MAYYNRSKINELVEEPDEEYVIGELQFDDTLNEVIKMCVYNKEDQDMPHFHLVRSNGPDICIMLTDNRYFDHGKISGMLSSHKECKKLNEWLNSKPINSFSRSHWELAVDCWIVANPNSNISAPNLTHPDYSTIKPYR